MEGDQVVKKLEASKPDSKAPPASDLQNEQVEEGNRGESDGAKPADALANDAPSVCSIQYEYLDHTADIQLHSWGTSLEEAIEQVIIAMYGYMVEDFATVESVYSMDFEASGHDKDALLYALMDACLYHFNAEPYFIGRTCRVLSLRRGDGTGGDEDFQIKLRAWGESFDLSKHPPGTEIKAITYSNMQVLEAGDSSEQKESTRSDKEERQLVAKEALGHGEGAQKEAQRVDIYVIVDI